MTQIEPIVFPLNLGTADYLNANLIATPGVDGARIAYTLIDSTKTPNSILIQNLIPVSEEDYSQNGNNKTWIINYVVEQLGITLI